MKLFDQNVHFMSSGRGLKNRDYDYQKSLTVAATINTLTSGKDT